MADFFYGYWAPGAIAICHFSCTIWKSRRLSLLDSNSVSFIMRWLLLFYIKRRHFIWVAFTISPRFEFLCRREIVSIYVLLRPKITGILCIFNNNNNKNRHSLISTNEGSEMRADLFPNAKKKTLISHFLRLNSSTVFLKFYCRDKQFLYKLLGKLSS